MTTLPPGPYRQIAVGEVKAPLYLVPFDKRGVCQGPRTREHLIRAAETGGFTHAYVFSHGWNNTFDQAVTNYLNFIEGYTSLRKGRHLPSPDPYNPLLVGIVWPSIDLTLPWERGPKFAGAPPEPVPPEVAAAELREIQEIGENLPPDTAGRFYELAEQPELSPEQARELASLLAPLYPTENDELGESDDRMSPDELMAVWAALATAAGRGPGPEDWGVADEGSTEPRVAGILKFDPRDVVRAFTVYKMKDRAGTVGTAGVGPLVRDLLTAVSETARVHLVGHSYGCRVLLSAVCDAPLPRPVESMLLLEPAVNYLCFARQVPKVGRPGGYRSALERVRQPILSTFSSRDRALHDLFHLAVRRGSDLGEMRIAALGAAPSIYAALGGWGPGGLDPDEAKEVEIKAHPDRYALENGTVEIYGLRGDRGISSHSDVVNDWTFWALYNQVMA